MLLKNENKVDGMVSIMETLQKYVPHQRVTSAVPVPDSQEVEVINIDHFHQILFGEGEDQLIVVRARGAQSSRGNSDDGDERLEGLVPVVEDWHAKVCLLGVSVSFEYCDRAIIINIFFLCCPRSSRDSGTLVQLRNLINRKTIPKDPKNEVNASEDFLRVMCTAHVVVAAMEVLEIANLETSTCKFIPVSPCLLITVLMAVAEKIVGRFVNIHVVESEKKTTEEADNSKAPTADGVHDYACEVLSLSLLYAEFHQGRRR